MFTNKKMLEKKWRSDGKMYNAPLDLHKAFDTVNQEIIVVILK